jgi:hypothetical protein
MMPTRESRLQTLRTYACPGEGGRSAVLTLELIESLTQAGDGRPPTLRELAEGRQRSVGAIQDHVALLKKAKLLSCNQQPRSFRVLDGAKSGWREVSRKAWHRDEDTDDLHLMKLRVKGQLEDAYNQADILGLDVEIIIRVKP